MGNIFNFLATTFDENSLIAGNACGDQNTFFIFQIAYTVVLILQIAVPFVLIVLGSIDFFKSVVAGDEKEMKQKRKPFVQRLIAAIVIFLIPFIVSLIMNTFFPKVKFTKCWNAAKDNRSITIPDEENYSSTTQPSGSSSGQNPSNP